MRIVSLVPSATELLFALGIGDRIVGVTHECDHPTEALELPKVTGDRLPAGLSAGQIDAAVREQTLEGRAIYQLDTEALRELEPDLIVTQALCAVCAVSHDDVVAVAGSLPSRPRVMSLDPRTLGEVLAGVGELAEATGRREAGEALVRDAAARIEQVRQAVRALRRPRVAALEWLDPVFVAGHWTPQIIDYAGGEDVLGQPGEHSEVVSWETVAAARPDVVVVMPCGYDAGRSREEALAFREELASVGAGQVVAVDAAAWYSRPGPRLVEGLEAMAHILHPERFPDPPGPVLAVEL